MEMIRATDLSNRLNKAHHSAAHGDGRPGNLIRICTLSWSVPGVAPRRARTSGRVVVSLPLVHERAQDPDGETVQGFTLLEKSLEPPSQDASTLWPNPFRSRRSAFGTLWRVPNALSDQRQGPDAIGAHAGMDAELEATQLPMRHWGGVKGETLSYCTIPASSSKSFPIAASYCV